MEDCYVSLDSSEEILKKIKEEFENQKKFTVMILGKTGVGKSMLINKMFNENLVESGIGKPITHSINRIEKQGYPLAIYDTPGLELTGKNAFDTLLDEVTDVIDSGIKSGDIGNAIHCIWYCVSTPSHRFESAEIDFLKRFLGKASKYDIPVIIVLTQSYSQKDAKEMVKEIEKEALPVKKILPVLAEDYAIDDEYIVKAYGLNTLAEITYRVIPETLQKTFAAVQKISLELKTQEAKKIIKVAVVSAGATGAAPIPFSDAPILVSTQLAMMAKMTVVFGIPLEKSTITAFLSGLLGTTGTTIVGKTIVSNLLKLIPGAGSVVGGVISGTTAAALTAALGEAYMIILSKVYSGELSISDLFTDNVKEQMAEILKERLKVKRDKMGEEISPETDI